MKHISIRAKLTFWFAALFIVVLVSVVTLFYSILITRTGHLVNTRLQHLCTGLWGFIEFERGQPRVIYNHDDPTVSHFVEQATRYFQLYDAESGRLLLQSSNPEVAYLLLSPEQATRMASRPMFNEALSGTAKLRFYNSVFRAGGHGYLLRVGTSTEVVRDLRWQMLHTLLFLLVPGAFMAVIAGWYIAGNMLQPVENLRRTAHEISISQLDRRLPLRGTGDELDALATTFNEVFARLDTAVANMKQFSTSISHELRTPLAVLQGEAEVALVHARTVEEYQNVLASQLEEFHRLRWLIDRLLELARAEAGEIQLHVRTLNLSALLHSLVEQMEPLARSKNIALEIECADLPRIVGDPRWLERAVLNLLDNAVKFTPENGQIRVRSSSHGEYAAIEVSDSGIGIPADAIPHIFDRFYQVDGTRPNPAQGVGLGLAIAKWIVEAHRGTIQAESLAGTGTRFTILLPLARSAIAAHV